MKALKILIVMLILIMSKNFDCHAYFDNVGGGGLCSRKHH